MRIGNDSAGFARLLAPVRATPSASADRNGDPGPLDLTVRSSGPAPLHCLRYRWEGWGRTPAGSPAGSPGRRGLI
jgi:hypothetical protein